MFNASDNLEEHHFEFMEDGFQNKDLDYENEI